MLRNVFTKTLWDARRSLLGWMIGTAAVAMMYASFYPQLANGAMEEAMKSFPQSMKDAFRLNDMTSAAGYLGANTFGIIVPLLALFFGASTGARAIAGDEESGQLDLLLAHPVSRARLLLERFAALAAGSVVISAAVLGALLLIRPAAKLTGVSAGQLAAQCVNLALLAVFFGALAICAGSAAGRRGLVFGATAVIGVLAYAMNSFGPQLGLEWAQKLSPFYYYIGGDPLRNGFQWGDAGVLAGASAVLVCAGLLTFTRRDINT
ncbi:ABC transporter permease subunit [Longispora albida]|uniref:ABC transporter permease subunit n=1 Tax=Longispora albida TaxID=203523 RepID=UPI0003620253|nr:ABC transporter permease subunit [Longispora albida]